MLRALASRLRTMLSLLVLPSIAGALFSFGVSLALCLRRPGNAWRDLAAAGFSVTWWCAGQTAWLLAEPEQRPIVAQFQYFGIALTPPLWLMTSLAFVGRGDWLTPGRRLLLLVIPVLSIVAAFTNDSHHLLWRRFVMGPGPGQVEIQYGGWFVVHTIYSYIMAAIGTLILAARFAASPLYRAQLFVVLMGPGLVLAMNLTYLTARGALAIDPTPASFAIMFFGVAWAMVRHHLFELLPLARGVTLEGLQDGMIVLDDQGRIVDTNPAARALMGAAGKDPLGARLSDLIPALDGTEEDKPLQELSWADGRRFQVRRSRVGTAQGAVILLRDMTSERNAQEELLRAQEKLREANRDLERLALTDSLTGLANRRSLSRKLEEEFARARRHGRALSFVMMDIDHFKQINDTHGHATGDRVLESVGRALEGVIRPGDTAARLGGEEFGVLLSETTLDEAVEATERIRDVLRSLPHETPDGAGIAVRLSFGVTTLLPSDAGPADLLARADGALYRTKAAGRDGITVDREGASSPFPKGEV
jgi:diguanylate cyclase (GGDEF)-like protein/PAS domain S-box-containing protein